MDWLNQHITDNPGHTVEETQGHPTHCLTCGDIEPPTRTWEVPGPWTLSRRQYLEAQAMLHGAASFWQAREAVSSVAIEHPEWRMDERKTWDEWNAELEGSTS